MHACKIVQLIIVLKENSDGNYRFDVSFAIFFSVLVKKSGMRFSKKRGSFSSCNDLTTSI